MDLSALWKYEQDGAVAFEVTAIIANREHEILATLIDRYMCSANQLPNLRAIEYSFLHNLTTIFQLFGLNDYLNSE